MADFSSRGPVATLDVLKPDVTAPGVSILAAVNNDDPGTPDGFPEFNFLGGTSMSSPHNAGAVALMTALYPDWTPHQIKSAMMTTADNVDNFKEDGVTPVDPFDVGAGRVDLTGAAAAGLVLDETTANFEAADPSTGGDPRTLNLANFSNQQCVLDCEWVRTVESTLPFTSTWTANVSAPMSATLTVSPTVFTIPPYGSQEITVMLSSDGAPVDTWMFGSVTLSNTDVEAAFLKVAHLAPFAMDPGTAVTVTLNGAPALTNFAYGDSTTYIPVEPGEYLVEVFPGSSTTAAITGTVNLMDDTYYTAVAVGDGVNQDLQLLAFVDDNTAPAAGQFHIRLGHLAPFASGSATADIRLQDGTPVLTGVNYSDVTGYIPLIAGTYDLKITTPGGGTTLIDPAPVTFVEGQVLYAFATGEGTNQDLAVFALPTTPDVTGFFLPAQEPYLIYLPVVLKSGGSTAAAPSPTVALPANIQAITDVGVAPDATFPLAVQFTTGELPDSIDVTTRRNAGSELVEGLQALEITDLTVDVIGLARADITEFQLFEDPTNSIPEGFFDDLSQVFWMTMTVPADSYSLVAEILETTSPDLDMAVGLDTGDGLPEESEIVCQSASGGSFESCEVMSPDAGTWWVVVLNWEESAAAPDDVSLATVVVPNSDSGNMYVEGPTAVPALQPFDIRVFWDTPTMMAGDRWYGAVSLGSAPGNEGDIGTIPVYVNRVEDDVVKTVDTEGVVYPGDIVEYTITVAPNVTLEDITYYLTDTIPAGLTYVDGSASATEGTVDVTGSVLTWTGVMAVPQFGYEVTDSVTTPACTMPLANSGAYVNLEGYGFLTNAAISGDGVAFQDTSYGGNPYAFFDDPRGTALYFNDDGIVSLDLDSILGTPYASNAAIPNADLPNALMSILWNDMEIVYEAGAGESNRGVTTGIQLTTGGIPSAKLLEFDDIQMMGDPSSQADFELLIREVIADGQYEIIFAFDNLTGNFTNMTVGTIGIEDWDGVGGTQYAYNDAALQNLENGMAICFDAVRSGDPIVITYQAQVDGSVLNDVVTNEVVHDTDTPGSMEATTSVDVEIGAAAFLQVAHLAPFAMDPGTAVTVTLNGATALTDFAYGDSTEYIPLAPDTYLVEIFPGSSPTPAITATVDLLLNTYYTAIATGDGVNQDLSLLAVVDDLTSPTSGNFKLRLGHVAPFASGSATADIRLQDGTPVLTNVNYLDVAPYLELPAGTYDLKITDPGGAVTLIDPAPVTLGDGDIVTAFATGEGTNQDLAVFALPAGVPGFFVPAADVALACNSPMTTFDGGIPNYVGWVVADNEGNGVIWESNAYWGDGNYTGGTGGAATSNSDTFGPAAYDTEMWTPSIDFTGFTTVTLDYLANFQNFGGNDFLDLAVSIDGGSIWTTVLSWNEDHGGFLAPPGEAVNVDLSAYAGESDVLLRWRYYDPNAGDDWNWYVQIDEVMLTCTP